MIELNDAKPQTFCQKLYAKSYDILEETSEYIASWSIGQTILKQADRCLWTLEKCAEWSLPNTQVPKQNGTKDTFGNQAPLVRPLPWALFLPMLVFLRTVRTCINMGAILVGVEPIKPTGVVRFIQVRRKRVRAIKFMGLRRMRQRKLSQQLSAISAPTWMKRINNILNGLMCFKAVHDDISVPITNNDISVENANSSANCGVYVKRKYMELLQWEDLDDDEELMEKIDKLAQERNEKDPDFLPVDEDSESEEDSSSEVEDITSTSTSQVVQSSTSRNSVTNESIEEENEESDSTAESDEEIAHLKESPSNCKSKDDLDSNKVKENSAEYQGESNMTDEFYSPQNSISVTPEPPKDIDEDFIKNNSKNSPIKSPAKSPSKSKDIQETENLIHAEKNEVNTKKNENSPNSHRIKLETFVASDKNQQANSVNNHTEPGE